MRWKILHSRDFLEITRAVRMIVPNFLSTKELSLAYGDEQCIVQNARNSAETFRVCVIESLKSVRVNFLTSIRVT